MIRVLNLATGKEYFYDASIGPRRAVICAYAQGKRDYNTREYDNYEPLVTEGKHTCAIQDYIALK